LAVVDVATGEDLSSVALEGYSRKISLARTRPQGLLPHLIGTHVAILYGAKPAAEEDNDDLDDGKDNETEHKESAS
jgi:hypothetical protein